MTDTKVSRANFEKFVDHITVNDEQKYVDGHIYFAINDERPWLVMYINKDEDRNIPQINISISDKIVKEWLKAIEEWKRKQ